MKFEEALAIVFCLAQQNQLENDVIEDDPVLLKEYERQTEAIEIVSDFAHNVDLSEFDADDEPTGRPVVVTCHSCGEVLDSHDEGEDQTCGGCGSCDVTVDANGPPIGS